MPIAPHRKRALRSGALLAAVAIGLFLLAPAASAVDPGKISVTAEGTTASRAIFSQHPDPQVRNSDTLAMKLISPDYWHYSLLCPDFKMAMAIIKMYRLYTSFYVNARTKHIDAIAEQAAAEGITQMVNLGAGFDSRAYRFHQQMPRVTFFEIDLPDMVKEKQRRVRQAIGEIPDRVVFVPIDFAVQQMPAELAKAGYDPRQKTLFIWEGVTYYIPAAAVHDTLAFIATRSAPGSTVVFDYLQYGVIAKDFKTYPDARGLAFWVAYKGEPFVFGLEAGEGSAFVKARGLAPLSDLGPKELEAKYLTRSDGSLDGPCASFFRIMHAKVPPL